QVRTAFVVAVTTRGSSSEARALGAPVPPVCSTPNRPFGAARLQSQPVVLVLPVADDHQVRHASEESARIAWGVQVSEPRDAAALAPSVGFFLTVPISAPISLDFSLMIDGTLAGPSIPFAGAFLPVWSRVECSKRRNVNSVLARDARVD